MLLVPTLKGTSNVEVSTSQNSKSSTSPFGQTSLGIRGIQTMFHDQSHQNTKANKHPIKTSKTPAITPSVVTCTNDLKGNGFGSLGPTLFTFFLHCSFYSWLFRYFFFAPHGLPARSLDGPPAGKNCSWRKRVQGGL